MKSKARLLCPSRLESSFAGWDTAHIRRTCKVLATNSPTEVLGATLGDAAAATAAGEEAVAKAAQLHHALASLDSTTLQRSQSSPGGAETWPSSVTHSGAQVTALVTVS